MLAILGMALVTYATRAGGLWLMGRVKPSPRVERWLRHIPGAVLISIVAPIVAASDPAELLAMLATVVVGARTGNILLTWTSQNQ
ncbi:MAG: AzlD domain-containing protein [Chloroflexota bacterium]|nr:AzlD domain-containing protein [Chloroflexota bacterium]